MFLLLTLSFLLSASKHEFYVSVGSIEISKDEKYLEYSAKYFTDDFEDALMERFNIKNREEAIQSERLQQYLSENIELKTPDKTLPMKFLGFEYEDDVTWVYLEFDKAAVNTKYSLKNTMLLNVRSRQVNILHVKARSTTTLSFNRKKPENTFTL